MPRSELDQAAAIAVIASSEVVRVAFRSGETAYLIPLGYVWMDSALYGVTDPGQKTELANANPEVAFQIDTSSV